MVRARKAVVGFIAQLAANNRQLEEVRKRRQLRLRKIMAAVRLRNSLTYFANNINKPKRIWTHTRHGKFWELDIPCNSDKFFKESFRMTRESLSILCNEVKCMAKRDTTYRKCIPLEKRVAIALYTLGSSAEYRTIGRLFGVSKASVYCILKAFGSAVWDKLAPQYLPKTFLTQDKIAECVRGFEKLGFPQCLGALDGCHIEIRPSAADAVDYYNYKGWYSMVLLALVDYRYRFMYINVGAHGRCNDSQIFEQSFLKQILQSPLMSENVKVIGGTNVPVVVLGDSAFRLSHFLMKPYPHNSAAEEKEKVFNYHQSKSRRVVENSFGQVKARFRRVGKGIDNDIKNAASIIKCCCVLHNFVNERNDNINSQWIQSQAIFETEHNREQPEPTYHPQGHNSNAESIREAIASFLCPP